MKNNAEFSKRLAKGRIAETIFWMMFHDDERFLIFPVNNQIIII